MVTISVLPVEGAAVCDFCGASAVAWTYPATSFALEAWEWESIGDWAACDPCSELIEGQRYAGLVQRRLRGVVDAAPGSAHERRVIQVMTLMYITFGAHRTGPRRAFTLIDRGAPMRDGGAAH